MKFSANRGSAVLVVLPLLMFLLVFTSCVSNNTANQNGNRNNSNTAAIADGAPINATDDLEELRKLIKLPFEPDEVLWLVETDAENKLAAGANATPNPVPDVSSKRLVVVLKFNEQNSAALIELVKRVGPGTNTSIEPESWFPPELVAEGETAGDHGLKGIQHSARDFYQAPYLVGKLVKIEQPGYFILEMTTF